MTQEERNEFNASLKRFKDTLMGFFIALVIFLLLSLFNCNGSRPEFVKKEVKGTFKSDKVKNEPIVIGTSIYESTETKSNRVTNSDNSKSSKSNDAYFQKQIDSLLQINKQLENDFTTLSDSSKITEYQKAIQLNKFSQTFDDENVKIDVSGIARGTVQSIKTDYNIKKQPIKERVFALKTGVEYGNTTTLNNSVFKGNLEFENRKGNSYNIGYDTDKRYWLGAKFTIFQIKR